MEWKWLFAEVRSSFFKYQSRVRSKVVVVDVIPDLALLQLEHPKVNLGSKSLK